MRDDHEVRLHPAATVRGRFTPGIPFAERVFAICGVYGILGLAPQYFMEAKLARDFPPALTHPEHFYGFIGVALAWQILFLIIAKEPVQLRLAMIPAILEKLAFGGAAVALFFQARTGPVVLAAGVVDLIMAVLFYFSFRATASRKPAPVVHMAGTWREH